MRIHLIATPRNVSTALLYSFAQRPDTRVVDEPFYAHYLHRSGADHPGRAEVLASQPLDADTVFAQLETPHDREHLFIKGMAHHLSGVDIARLARMPSLFLVRDPARSIASFAQVIATPTLDDIGLRHQCELLQALGEARGRTAVLDSDRLLQDPEGSLRAACTWLGIPFLPGMLRWDPGPRPEDGVWAPHWYANVHRSNGFAAQPTSARPFPERLRPLLEEALPYYALLHRHALNA